MFKVGDRVRLKKPGTHRNVTYNEILEGVVRKPDYDGNKAEYNGKICEVVFEGLTKISTYEYRDQAWWIDNDDIELVTTKRKRKKKEPIPEGWE